MKVYILIAENQTYRKILGVFLSLNAAKQAREVRWTDNAPLRQTRPHYSQQTANAIQIDNLVAYTVNNAVSSLMQGPEPWNRREIIRRSDGYEVLVESYSIHETELAGLEKYPLNQLALDILSGDPVAVDAAKDILLV